MPLTWSSRLQSSRAIPASQYRSGSPLHGLLTGPIKRSRGLIEGVAMQVGVRVFNVDEPLPLDEAELDELTESGSLRLEFPAAVLRYAIVSGLVLQALFEA